MVARWRHKRSPNEIYGTPTSKFASRHRTYGNLLEILDEIRVSYFVNLSQITRNSSWLLKITTSAWHTASLRVSPPDRGHHQEWQFCGYTNEARGWHFFSFIQIKEIRILTIYVNSVVIYTRMVARLHCRAVSLLRKVVNSISRLINSRQFTSLVVIGNSTDTQ